MLEPLPLLFLSPRVPHPLNTGAKIRTRALLNALSASFAVDYAGFLQPELDEGDARGALTGCQAVTLVPEPATTRGGKAWLGLRTLLDSRPATVAKYDAASLGAHVRQWLMQHPTGLLHADHVHMAGYLELAQPGRGIMDEHNVEAVILERLAEQYGTSPAAPYFRLQARRMRATETRLVRRAALTLAVSEGDAAQLRAMAPGRRVEVIPNGVDLEFFASPRAGTLAGRVAGRLVFTGSMNWFPNEDGVLWFMRDVWPRLGPEYSVDVVGHAPSSAVRAVAAERVRVTGTVDDTRVYVNDAEVFIVPLRIGGGSRLKILEAFAMGIPVVSTEVGCEGLGVAHERELLIADTPEAFAAAIARVRTEPGLAERMTAAATAHVRAHFGWPAIGDRLVELVRSLKKP